MTDVVLDLGKSRCRARSGDASGEAVGAPGLSTPSGVGAALASIEQAVADAGVGPVARLVVGAAGALTEPAAVPASIASSSNCAFVHDCASSAAGSESHTGAKKPSSRSHSSASGPCWWWTTC